MEDKHERTARFGSRGGKLHWRTAGHDDMFTRRTTD
jgi:hypothetical protein